MKRSPPDVRHRRVGNRISLVRLWLCRENRERLPELALRWFGLEWRWWIAERRSGCPSESRLRKYFVPEAGRLPMRRQESPREIIFSARRPQDTCCGN